MARVGRLHAADGGEVEAAFLRVEGGHGARAVDADQPVGFRAALRRVGERQHLLVGAQRAKPSRIDAGVIDCSHRRSIGFLLRACCTM